MYVPESYVLNEIDGILQRIKLPEEVVKSLKDELKKAKASEKSFCKQEILKLNKEHEDLKRRLDALFDLRLDNELDKETFDRKHSEVELKMGRIKDKISAHEKVDNKFNSNWIIRYSNRSPRIVQNIGKS